MTPVDTEGETLIVSACERRRGYLLRVTDWQPAGCRSGFKVYVTTPLGLCDSELPVSRLDAATGAFIDSVRVLWEGCDALALTPAGTFLVGAFSGLVMEVDVSGGRGACALSAASKEAWEGRCALSPLGRRLGQGIYDVSEPDEPG